MAAPTYADVFKNATQVANSNWGETMISFSPTIVWEDDRGRRVRIGYAERQWASGTPDDAVIKVEPADGSAADYICVIDAV